MMGVENDLSGSTFVVSAVIFATGWVLKKTISYVSGLLIDASKSLIAKLTETIARVEIMNAEMIVLTQAVGDHKKLRADLNKFYERLKDLERRFDSKV